MSSNLDVHRRFLDRLIGIEQEKRALAEAQKDIGTEMKTAIKNSVLSKIDVRGIKLAVKQHFEDAQQHYEREEAQSIASALGSYAETPLGRAAVEAGK